MTSVFATKITKIYNALVNRINDSISTHNNSASAHSFGSNNASKNVVTDASGNLITQDKTVANVTDPNSANYTSIATMSAGATQQTINSNINSAIDALQDELYGLEEDLLA